MRSKAWHKEIDPYAAEIAEMVRHLASVSPEHDVADLIRREFRAAWEVLRKRHNLRWEPWAYKLWRDAVARQMGWLRGRIGRPQDEHVRQRILEAAGQTRLFEEVAS